MLPSYKMLHYLRLAIQLTWNEGKALSLYPAGTSCCCAPCFLLAFHLQMQSATNSACRSFHCKQDELMKTACHSAPVQRACTDAYACYICSCSLTRPHVTIELAADALNESGTRHKQLELAAQHKVNYFGRDQSGSMETLQVPAIWRVSLRTQDM